MSPELVYISIGSNIDPVKHIPPALDALRNHPDIDVKAISSLYISEALDRPEQPNYLNGVILIETSISPESLKFDVLRPIEDQQGRVRTDDRFAPRTLDLDIILFGDRVIVEGPVEVPDPAIGRHAFVTIPLLEIAPTICIPGMAEDLASLATMSPEEVLEVDDSLTRLVQKGLPHG